MKLTELYEGIDYSSNTALPDIDITSLEYDSRKANASSLFFCMPGARADGHDFADSAYENGCRAFAVERFLDLPSDAVQIKTGKTRQTLAVLSCRFYGNPSSKLKVIGVTGTKGKTTTSLLIRGMLEYCGIKCGYIGTNGADIADRHYPTQNSTPESRELQRLFAEMLESGCTHAVIEVSSQALDNFRAVGTEFDTVIFTNLSPDHIGTGEHASFEEYRDAKRKLFTEYSAKYVIYNADDPYSGYMVADSSGNKISYGFGKADRMLSDTEPFRDDTSLGTSFLYSYECGSRKLKTRAPGDFSVYNAAAAYTACLCAGAEPDLAAAALENISIKGRFEIVDALPGRTFIIDYAHNGVSMTKALSVLRGYAPSRLTVLFGCVGRTYVRRREMAEAASALADFTIITTDNPDTENPDEIIADVLNYFDKSKQYVTITDREEAIRYAVRASEPGDIVLLAGKGHEDYQIVNGKKIPFCEKEILLSEAGLINDEKAEV